MKSISESTLKNIFEKGSDSEGAVVTRFGRLLRLAIVGGVVVIIALVPQACGPKSKVASEDRPQISVDQSPGTQAQPAGEFRFDPLGLDRDLSIITDVYRDSLPTRVFGDSSLSDELEPAADSVAVTDSTVSEAYDTYRIQLFNSRVFTEATLEKEVAQEIFDYTATLDYEVPYFKVRLGDFSERKTAVTYLREFVKPAGYPNSWITRVRVAPHAALVTDSALAAYYDSLRNEIFYGETLGVWVDTLDDTLRDTLNDTPGDRPGDTLNDD